MDSMDSILNWTGGKHLSCKKIVKIMPGHHCYVEPFFGAGWILFSKPRTKVEVINDINGELMNFWKAIQRQPEEFKEREKYEMYSRETYHEYCKDFYEGRHQKMSDIERAFRFFCMIKCAFASNCGSWGYGQSRNLADAFFNEFKIIDEIAERLKHVQIDNKDFEFVIKDYDSETTLHNCDPPYIKTNVNTVYLKSMEANNVIEFGLHDHQRLYNTLSKIKGKFILTIDDCSFVRERYCEGEQGSKGFYWIENKVAYSYMDKNNRRHATELIITNYDTNEVTKQNKLKKGKEEQIKLKENSKSLEDY